MLKILLKKPKRDITNNTDELEGFKERKAKKGVYFAPAHEQGG
jgi:hypothetical protein